MREVRTLTRSAVNVYESLQFHIIPFLVLQCNQPAPLRWCDVLVTGARLAIAIATTPAFAAAAFAAAFAAELIFAVERHWFACVFDLEALLLVFQEEFCRLVFSDVLQRLAPQQGV